ncbi:MAG TPA: hypothetical protein DD671_04745 [Balneolaceae bacterium]|nr:hypothetical protein [Balneolaceae bacterium]
MLTKRSKACLTISLSVMAGFFIEQTLVISGFVLPSYFSALFGYACTILFTVSFICFAIDFLYTVKSKKQIYDDKLAAIHTSNMVAIYDNEGLIISANQNFCDTTGYNNYELVGSTHCMVMPREMIRSEEYRSFWEQLNRGIFLRGKYRRRKKCGNDYWCYATYSPIRNGSGKVYQIIEISSDVTEEYLAQQELAHKNIYLEHAAKILRHDMHSGINTYIPRGIRSLERRINQDIIDELHIESPLKLIKEGLLHAQRVYRGVYEFTNLVKKDAEMQRSKYDLKSILEEYISKTAYADQVIIEELINLEVNEALFCTAIDNLIRNGLKYNDSVSKLLRVKMHDQSHIAVEDNGRGLSQKEFEEFCKPYQRKKGQKEPGSGLGLNISVAIFNEHGFRMSIDELQQGTRILIQINEDYLDDCTLIRNLK